MTYSHYSKMIKQLSAKPAKLQKYNKHNKPKDRTTGINKKRCRRCWRTRAHIDKYGLNLCRQCFREVARKIGFKKYS